ncbi:hypothetical protein MCNS_32900 [Mycobacterium conspicuum]|uniref:Uncharacterized protein n=1 Tax=Mycobacterium conspicuum TaxID=44010 RepID=A0A7I7YFV9_9MYCO|nr:hypothetical protein MCNS_32900 [Mycobacterium conspicuum]
MPPRAAAGALVSALRSCVCHAPGATKDAVGVVDAPVLAVCFDAHPVTPEATMPTVAVKAIKRVDFIAESPAIWTQLE